MYVRKTRAFQILTLESDEYEICNVCYRLVYTHMTSHFLMQLHYKLKRQSDTIKTFKLY